MKIHKQVESQRYLTVIDFICPGFIKGFVTEEKKIKRKKNKTIFSFLLRITE